MDSGSERAAVAFWTGAGTVLALALIVWAAFGLRLTAERTEGDRLPPAGAQIIENPYGGTVMVEWVPAAHQLKITQHLPLDVEVCLSKGGEQYVCRLMQSWTSGLEATR